MKHFQLLTLIVTLAGLIVTFAGLIVAIESFNLMKSDSNYMRIAYEQILGYVNQKQTHQKQTQESLGSKIVPQKTQQNKQRLVVDPQERRLVVDPQERRLVVDPQERR